MLTPKVAVAALPTVRRGWAPTVRPRGEIGTAGSVGGGGARSGQEYTPQHVVLDASDASAAVLSLAYCDGAAVALTTSGCVYAWGSDVHGVTGLQDDGGGDGGGDGDGDDGEEVDAAAAGEEAEYYPRPLRVPAFVRAAAHVVQVACGPQHVLARVADAAAPVWSWGCGHGHRLGHGDDRDRRAPTPITALSGMPVTHVAAAGAASFALTDRRTLMALLAAMGATLPRPITPPASAGAGAHVRFADGAAGGGHDVDVLEATGRSDAPPSGGPAHGYTGQSLLVWGTGLQGQLGLGNTCTQVPLPTAVPTFETTQTSIAFVVRAAAGVTCTRHCATPSTTHPAQPPTTTICADWQQQPHGGHIECRGAVCVGPQPARRHGAGRRVGRRGRGGCAGPCVAIWAGGGQRGPWARVHGGVRPLLHGGGHGGVCRRPGAAAAGRHAPARR